MTADPKAVLAAYNDQTLKIATEALAAERTLADDLAAALWWAALFLAPSVHERLPSISAALAAYTEARK